MFACFTLLTLGASPLAFLLLVVLLAGVALGRRGEHRRFAVHSNEEVGLDTVTGRRTAGNKSRLTHCAGKG